MKSPCVAAVQFAGNVVATIPASDSVTFVLDQGAVAQVDMMDAGLARIRFNPSGSFSTQLSGAISPTGLVPPGSAISDSASVTYISSSQLIVAVFKAPFQVVIFRPDGSFINADLAPGIAWDPQAGTILDRKFAPASEHYFGLGMRGGPIDRRGRKFTMQNVDWGGYGEFTDPLYSSTPFYYGVNAGQAYGVFLDNPDTPFFDMDSQGTGVLTFGALQGELDYYVMAGPSPQQVAYTYARLTGFPPLPPEWALGYHQSRYTYASQQDVLSIASQFRAQQIPCDALYLDLGYMDQQHIFTWDPVNFSAPQNLNSTLASEGFEQVNIFDPVVLSSDPLWPYLAGSGYFLTGPDGTPLVNNIFYGNVSWIDFTKPAAHDWYKQTLESFLSTGVTAVWNDLNEPAQNFMPQAIYNFNGQPRSDLQARDLYALNETSVSYAAQQELRPNLRPWILSRSGYPGIQRYAANWSGDTLSSFDSLRVSVEISQSMGLSGIPMFGHDVGGFLGSPSAELFIRWLEFGSLTPYFRTHSDATQREPWVYGEPYTSMARNVIGFRYHLLPYLYSLVSMSSAGGQPVLAPAAFYFAGDPQTYTQDQEFMVGPNLLVAPVLVSGATTRTVYLPNGSRWLDYYTDTLYDGGQTITVSAPLDRLPLFVREGAIIPSGPALQFVAQAVAPQVTLDLYPGTTSSFNLYEDDGATTDYTRGVYLQTQIARSETAANITLTINRASGSFQPPQRPWWLYFHQVPSTLGSVQLNGIALPAATAESDLQNMTQGWFYRTIDKRLIVRIPESASLRSLVINR